MDVFFATFFLICPMIYLLPLHFLSLSNYYILGTLLFLFWGETRIYKHLLFISVLPSIHLNTTDPSRKLNKELISQRPTDHEFPEKKNVFGKTKNFFFKPENPNTCSLSIRGKKEVPFFLPFQTFPDFSLLPKYFLSLDLKKLKFFLRFPAIVILSLWFSVSPTNYRDLTRLLS